MAESINVVMLGASRVGKTAILASMLDNASRQEVSSYFRIKDRSNSAYEALKASNPKRYDEVVLSSSIDEMKDMLNNTSNGRQSLPGLMGSQDSFNYKIGIEAFSSDGSLQEGDVKINFLDIPGERFNSADIAFTELENKIKEAQTLIVAVDTPSLMWLHGRRDGVEGLKSVLFRPDEVNSAIQCLGQKYNDIGKMRMVIFVPIKCEYLINSVEGANMIYDAIEDMYKESILTCKRFPNMETLIMPIETIGGLKLDHISKEEQSSILIYGNAGANVVEDEIDEHSVTRCESDAENGSVCILKDGNPYFIEEGDKIIPATERKHHPYCVQGKVLPYTWYKKNINGEYQPKGCDQLLYKVLEFSIDSAFNDYNAQSKGSHNDKGGFWSLVGKIVNRLKELFKGSSFEDVEIDTFIANIKQMKDRGIISNERCKCVVGKR